MSAVLDYLNLCRLCLVKDKVNIAIFDETSDVRQLFLKISACLPVKVAQDDRLPKKICESCLYKVDLLYQFWNTTISSEKQLLQWCGGGNTGSGGESVAIKGSDDTLMLPQSHAHPHSIHTETIILKEERLDSADTKLVDDEYGPDLSTPTATVSANDLYSEEFALSYQQQQQLTEATSNYTSSVPNQAQKKRPRGRPPGSTKKKRQSTRSKARRDSVDDSDDDRPLAAVISDPEDHLNSAAGLQITKKEAESDEDYVDNSESLEPTTFVAVPSTSACELPGPSGIVAKGTTSTSTEPGQTHHHKHVVNGGAGLVESGDIHMEHDYAFKSTEDEETVDEPTELEDDDDDTTLLVETLDMDDDDDGPVEVVDTEQIIMVADAEEDNGDDDAETAEETLDNDEDLTTENNILTDIVNHPAQHDVAKDHKCYTIRFMSDNKDTHQCVYECDICGKRFRNKRCAKLCKNTADKDPYSKYYLCEICGKVFTYISSFIAHHNFKHSDQKLFLKQQRLMECSVCLKKFSTKWNLKTHMQSHMNVFPYLCEFCGKKFKKSDIFKIHLRIHTGIKPYACPQCEKRFATKGMMTTHLRTHTGEKPYACEFCDKSYAGMTALRMHRRMHTGERPFRCHLCPTERTFVTKKALRFHLKQPLHD